MIISHSRKFIFLHGRKTAGSSIGISLMRYLTKGDVVRGYITGGLEVGVTPPDWNNSLLYLRPRDFLFSSPRIQAYRRFVKKTHEVSSTHMSAAQIKKLVGDSVWENYFKFTFERNPFDRMISFYHWRTRYNKNKPSFGDFINALYMHDKQKLQSYNLFGCSNLPFYTIDNELSVDFVGKYESLKSDLAEVFDRLEIEDDGWLPKNKTGVRPPTANYQDVANERITAQMKEIFKREIELFNYTVPAKKKS